MRNKRKGILMASAILGSAAIVSTGFAAWVITSEPETTATGNIDVDTVHDDRILVNATWVDGKDDVVFGRPESASTGWLTNTDGPVQNLDLALSVNISLAHEDASNYETADLDGTLTVDFVINDGKSIDPQYIVVPSYTSSYTVTDGTLSSNIPVKFSWGTYFGGQNPYNFYNDGDKKPNDKVSQESNDTWGDHAYTGLNAIQAYSEYTFTITLTFTLTLNP